MTFPRVTVWYPGICLFVCWLVTHPRAVAQAPDSTDVSQWYPWQVTETGRSSRIDMGPWLDAPAGKHGFVQAAGEDYRFEDGTPVRFWGVNVTTWHVFPTEDKAAEWVAFLRRYGVNAVRMHKFTWDATDGRHSTQLTPDHWRRLDRFTQTLARGGIYYGWSHIYGHRVLPADSSRLLAYDEVRDLRYPWSHLDGSTSGLVNFADDLQQLNIELTVNMLEHTNESSGLRYADDPALAFVELQNEDDIYWGAVTRALDQAPTYRALLCRKFSDWLLDKYGSEGSWRSAWSEEGIAPGATLAAGTVYPHPDHGWFSGYYVRAAAAGLAVPRHVTDRARFLYEQQLAYYDRAARAIRATGYRGMIIGSCWQAGSGITHYYNLHADYVTGPIDRHNYWGGGAGHRLRPGRFDNRSLLADPGAGLLSSGWQQVSGRPFQFSEWMALIPNEWTAEAAPLVAAYGMGLQGWDGSFAFALDEPSLSQSVDAHGGIYQAGGPTHLPLYPALAAMVYRGDVREGEVTYRRGLGLEDLAAGRLPFRENVRQDHDRKVIEGGFPPAALLHGKTVVDFAAAGFGLLGPPDGVRADTVVSSTGQLRYVRVGPQGGRVTINTPGTQAVIGFTDKETIELDDVSLLITNPFAVVFVSSLDRDKPIATAQRILVTTLARARNTDMQYAAPDSLISVGGPPAILEPVQVRLALSGGVDRVYVLDHLGARTGETITEQDGALWLDGQRYRTCYYEIVRRPAVD